MRIRKGREEWRLVSWFLAWVTGDGVRASVRLKWATGECDWDGNLAADSAWHIPIICMWARSTFESSWLLYNVCAHLTSHSPTEKRIPKGQEQCCKGIFFFLPCLWHLGQCLITEYYEVTVCRREWPAAVCLEFSSLPVLQELFSLLFHYTLHFLLNI